MPRRRPATAAALVTICASTLLALLPALPWPAAAGIAHYRYSPADILTTILALLVVTLLADRQRAIRAASVPPTISGAEHAPFSSDLGEPGAMARLLALAMRNGLAALALGPLLLLPPGPARRWLAAGALLLLARSALGLLRRIEARPAGAWTPRARLARSVLPGRWSAAILELLPLVGLLWVGPPGAGQQGWLLLWPLTAGLGPPPAEPWPALLRGALAGGWLVALAGLAGRPPPERHRPPRRAPVQPSRPSRGDA